MKTISVITLVFAAGLVPLAAQTIYAPGGTVGNISGSNVGIGTASPSAKLDVNGASHFGTGTDNVSNTLNGLSVQDSGGNAVALAVGRSTGRSAGLVWYDSSPTGSAVLYTFSNAAPLTISASTINLSPGSGSALYINNQGNVGIGASTPGSLLDVFYAGSSATNNPGNAVLRVTAAYGANPKFLNIGYDATLDEGYLQPVHSGTGGFFSNLLLNPNGGNVGIGTTNPQASLHVFGSVSREVARFQGSSDVSNNRNYISIYTTNPGFWWELSNQDAGGGGNTNGLAFRERSGGGSSIERVYLASGGNVGIGTTNPTQKLSVAGTIQAKEVIVQTGWSDYVFDESYRLAPLSEVEQHIKAEKHLPGIPSAQEVAEHGVSMGDMQSKLLAKVEELTLHVIEQEKRALAQEKQLTAQAGRISQLEADNATLRNH